MERVDNISEDTKIQARKLLDSNMEMLHVYAEGHHCVHCGKWKEHTRFDEECPVLLRAALLSFSEQNKVKPYEKCGICGGRMAEIRGRYPRDEERTVCPTCAVERLEQISQIADRDYGKAFKASPLIRPLAD